MVHEPPVPYKVSRPAVLAVDDRAANLLALDALFAERDFDFVFATSGAEALKVAAQREFALVLLDIQMPGIDGYEVLTKLKSSGKSASTPVIFISANSLTRDEEVRAYRLGIADIILKPIIPEILQSKLKNFVSLFEGNQSRYRTLFESVDQGFCVLEMIYDKNQQPVDYRFLEVNSTFEKQTGLKNAAGRTARELIPGLDAFWFKTYGEVAKTGKAKRFEQEAAAMDRIFDVYAFKVGGALTPHVGLLFSDITDRKRAQIDFERNVDVSPAILWITEKDGSCTYLSKQWYDYTGQTPEQALGFGWLDATHPDDKERTANIYIEANKMQKQFYCEYRLKTKDGSYRWAIDAGNPRYDKAGNYLGYAGTVFDIHERKVAEETARDLQYRFMRSAQATELGVWYCDLPFDVLIWNDEVKRHFFLPADAHVTIDMFYEIIHPEDREPTRLAIQRSIETRTAYDTVYRTVNLKNPSEVKSVRAVGWTDYDAEGAPLRFDGITLDVTKELKTSEELRIAKDAAEHANELKSAFLANMSHEIRTPLGAMIGFADLLRDPGLSGNERANFIDILSRNGEQLAVIINDILDLSKVEAGHLTLEFIDTSPDQIVSDVLSLLRVKAKEKDLVLEYISDKSTPKTVVTDPVRIRQVLLNLVSNAIKFTQFGSIKVRSYGGKNEAGKTTVNFEIEDTGIGIPETQSSRIFEVFVQADGTMTRRFGGTGLGLALSRRLARALGGDVEVIKSIEGKGTTFLFSLEDQPSRRETHSTLSNEEILTSELKENALDGLRILVVDDAPDNQQLIWRYLTKRGATVDSAENGFVGYRKALAGNFDLVLMDIQMPEMDGYTATEKLRSAGYSKPIIALTAHAMTEVRKKCLNVGYTDHLPKPINPKDLISTIVRYTAH